MHYHPQWGWISSAPPQPQWHQHAMPHAPPLFRQLQDAVQVWLCSIWTYSLKVTKLKDTLFLTQLFSRGYSPGSQKTWWL